MKMFKHRTEESIMQRYGALILLILVFAVNCIITNNFLSISTLWNLVVQCTTVMLLSMGMMVVVGTGGIDVSVGAIIALSSTIIVVCKTAGVSSGLSVIIAVAVAALVGTISGLVIATFKIQPLIVTLGLMTALRGIAQLISHGKLIPLRSGPFLKKLAYYRIGGLIPVQLIIILIAVLFFYILYN